MRTTRVVPILIAAGLVATASCSDTTTPTSPGTVPQTGPTTSQTTLYGTIHLSQIKGSETVLSMGDGDVPLTGAGSAGLASVENAEVEVRGQFNAESFVVADFLVRRVGGSDVLDGVLIALYDQEIGGDSLGYGLSLTRGSIVPLMDPPADLIAHMGERVWIVESDQGQASAFGIITAR